jgi:hypothetical protein
MKVIALFAGVLLVGSHATAQVKSGAEAWGPAPPGLPAGSQATVLAGDPTKPGPFVIRAKMPAGYAIPPHWHPTDENVTVISGELVIGMGDKVDAAKGAKLSSGDFISMKSKMHHFATTASGAVVQISATGPFEITYINAADDPRRR